MSAIPAMGHREVRSWVTTSSGNDADVAMLHCRMTRITEKGFEKLGTDLDIIWGVGLINLKVW